MIEIGKRYMYDGREVVVEDGDRVEQSWTVTVVATGQQIMGIMTSQLKEIK